MIFPFGGILLQEQMLYYILVSHMGSLKKGSTLCNFYCSCIIVEILFVAGYEPVQNTYFSLKHPKNVLLPINFGEIVK